MMKLKTPIIIIMWIFVVILVSVMEASNSLPVIIITGITACILALLTNVKYKK